MIRDVNLADISDGRKYRSSDTVKIDTLGCRGCSSCCHDVDDTIKLDPMDIWRLETGTGTGFTALLEGKQIQLQVVDGLIIPNLSVPDQKHGCTFLDEQGRCSIHAYRPGFCRLFPLGRVYEEDGSFSYFVQVHECSHMAAKIRIRKWLGISNISAYETYISRWHRFCREAQRVVEGISSDSLRTKVCTHILEVFFAQPWTGDGAEESGSTEAFYAEFDKRMAAVRRMIGLAPETVSKKIL